MPMVAVGSVDRVSVSVAGRAAPAVRIPRPTTSLQSRAYKATLHVRPTLNARRQDDSRNCQRSRRRIWKLRRGDRATGASSATATIEAGDLIPIVGTIDQLREASESLRAPLASEWVMTASIRTTDEREEDRAHRGSWQSAATPRWSANPCVRRASPTVSVLRSWAPTAPPTRTCSAVAFRRPNASTSATCCWCKGTSEGLVELERTEGTMVLRDVLELPRTAKAPLALAITAAVVRAGGIQAGADRNRGARAAPSRCSQPAACATRTSAAHSASR